MAVNDLITFRKGTASAWTSANPVLASGEPGYDLTNSILKIGDGVSNWVSLSGIGSTSVGGSSSSSFVGVRGIISTTGTLTSFAVSGGYPVGYLDLFQDGIKLVSDLDFSATDGSNVTLSNSVPSGTVLEYLTMASGVSSGGGSLSGSVTIPGSDPYWDSVLLLLRGDGNFTDSSKYGRTLTAYGNAAATAAGKYGTNSIALDGTGDYLSVSSGDFSWGTSDWTAEAWVWLTAYGTYGSYFSTFFSNGSPYGVSVGVTNTGYPFLMHPGGANIQGSSLLPTGQWVHLAAVRASGVVNYYVNGTSVGSVTAADSHGQSNVVVGRTYTELNNNYWNGRIAELRVTKAARYTANFTPPTAALPTTILQASPQILPVTITGSSGNSSGLSWSSVPASSSASGTTGQIAYDSNYFYVATASNTWKRSILSSWFSLNSISSLNMWLDASVSSSLRSTTSGGSIVDINGSVARWEDQSGNGNHFTQSDSQYCPIYDGTGLVLAENTGRYLLASYPITENNFSFFAAIVLNGRNNSRHTYGRIFSGAPTTSGGADYADNNGLLFADFPSPSLQAYRNSSIIASTTALSIGTRVVVGFTVNSGSVTIYRNKSYTSGSTSSTPVNIQTVRLGNNAAPNTDSSLNGAYYEVVMFNSALDNTTSQSVIDYLMSKWSIA